MRIRTDQSWAMLGFSGASKEGSGFVPAGSRGRRNGVLQSDIAITEASSAILDAARQGGQQRHRLVISSGQDWGNLDGSR